jgi:hypothetical protein
MLIDLTSLGILTYMSPLDRDDRERRARVTIGVVPGDVPVPGRPASGLPAGSTVIPSYPMYSAGQIAAATFLGSPIAGGWLLALNYKRLGEPRSARAAIGLSVLAMAALIASALVVLDRAMSSLGITPVVVMYVVYVVMMYWIAKSLQDAGYQRHLARLGRTASNLRVLGIALASLASLAICGGTIFGAVIGYESWNAPGEITVGSSNVL